MSNYRKLKLYALLQTSVQLGYTNVTFAARQICPIIVCVAGRRLKRDREREVEREREVGAATPDQRWAILISNCRRQRRRRHRHRRRTDRAQLFHQ